MAHEVKTKVLVAPNNYFIVQRMVGAQRWKHIAQDMVAANRIVDAFEITSAFYYDLIARRTIGTFKDCVLERNLEGNVLTYNFTDDTYVTLDIFSKEAVYDLMDEIIEDAGIIESTFIKTFRKDFLARIRKLQKECRGHDCETFLHYLDREPVMISPEEVQELMRLMHNSDRRLSKVNHCRKVYLPNRKSAK